jgi:hypothetical protein
MTPYEQLALRPDIVAVVVAEHEYKGEEWSLQLRDGGLVQQVEERRRKLTRAQVDAFADAVDALCRASYARKARWFMRIVRARGNRGRDQLYTWASHWLCSYALRPEKFFWERR